MKLSILGKIGLGAIGFCILSAGSVVRAETVLLEDNFDAENGGIPITPFFDFQNWTVEDGSVDLIGPNLHDLVPGNGLYLDLDGSTYNAGRLVSSNLFSFDVGDKINLSFDLIGSNGPNNNVEVSLGNLFSENFTNNDIGTIFRTFEVTSPATDAALIFDHAGGDQRGLLLDNVRLTVEPVNVAEPSSTIALLGLGAFGLGKAARDRKKR